MLELEPFRGVERTDSIQTDESLAERGVHGGARDGLQTLEVTRRRSEGAVDELKAVGDDREQHEEPCAGGAAQDEDAGHVKAVHEHLRGMMQQPAVVLLMAIGAD